VILGTILLIALVIAGLVGLYGWFIAHARSAPGQRVDDLGPIYQAFPISAAHLGEVLRRQTHTMRGVRVIEDGPSSIVLSVRPSIGRLDDAMGLFVTIAVADSAGQGWYKVTGQAKSRVGLVSSSRRALVEFERQLRMGMKHAEGLVALGSQAG
jgi:hypothetical protein